MDGVQWIFGYGSLVWRPAFPYAERRAGTIRGFARRFWQYSTDHRGTPERPGRVVTLIDAPGQSCGGLGYRVEADVLAEVISNLDHREKNGYRKLITPFRLAGEARTVDALLYIAGPDNPHYAGPAPLDEIAAAVRGCRGPSGANEEYVLELAQKLERLGFHDPHVAALAERLVSGVEDM